MKDSILSRATATEWRLEAAAPCLMHRPWFVIRKLSLGHRFVNHWNRNVQRNPLLRHLYPELYSSHEVLRTEHTVRVSQNSQHPRLTP